MEGKNNNMYLDEKDIVIKMMAKDLSEVYYDESEEKIIKYYFEKAKEKN